MFAKVKMDTFISTTYIGKQYLKKNPYYSEKNEFYKVYISPKLH